jgi:hypothetical protein
MACKRSKAAKPTRSILDRAGRRNAHAKTRNPSAVPISDEYWPM